MVNKPFEEVNDAIAGLSKTTGANLGDWWKLRGAYDRATKSLAKYTKQTEDLNTAMNAPGMYSAKKDITYSEKLNSLNLQIMQAQDKQQWEQAALLAKAADFNQWKSILSMGISLAGLALAV
jgi:hypothetical protein